MRRARSSRPVPPRAWPHISRPARPSVEPTTGDYHDAIHVKKNTVVLLLHNIFGGFAHGAVRHLRALAARDVADRTEYCEGETRGETAANFVTHHAQRISAAIVTGDARRCLNRIPGLQQLATLAASATAAVGGAARRRRA